MSSDRISGHEGSSDMVLTDDQVQELTDFSLEAKAFGHFELGKGLGMQESEQT